MNRLQYESSPYLLQHAHNPVDWYAWKPEAFERARRENKPLLVSIGYSTCHWCHVMERESFEDTEVADVMNERFVCIKVDREERPDVDAIYMEACQILTGSGGWPLNCFLTPDGRPFYAGTYYPPRPAYNRPSWLQVLLHLSNVWETKRDTVFEQADKLMGHIQRNDDVFVGALPGPDAPPPVFDAGLLENIFYQMRERFDRVEGGFGGAPKFPSTMAIQYLLNYHYFTGNNEALEQAELSLHKMIGGGIYDQIGGGFARYATDREWLIPHFEKMLYDNALLTGVLAEAYKLTRKPVYRQTIEETLGFIEREMTHTSGGFFSALDADSEGVEGKFYVWDKSEIEALLGPDAELFCAFYGVSDAGNWEHHNILWRPHEEARFAETHGVDPNTLAEKLRQGRERLLAARSKRIYPGLDDKILLGWNALMASGYVAAFTALGDEKYRRAAETNIRFLLREFADPEAPQRLLHTWKNGQKQYAAFLDDYALLLAALIDVYQITFDPEYLTHAEKYTEYVLSSFLDESTGLFFYTGSEQQDVVMRKKDLYDNALPSGNSTMVLNLQRLAVLLDRPDWKQSALRMLQSMRDTVERYPLSFERWACAMMLEVYPLHEIGVLGDDAPEKALELQSFFIPNKVVAASRTEAVSIPLLAGKTGGTDAWVYVCRNYTCHRPVQQLAEAVSLLQGAEQGGSYTNMP